jgi:hypothetical protein
MHYVRQNDIFRRQSPLCAHSLSLFESEVCFSLRLRMSASPHNRRRLVLAESELAAQRTRHTELVVQNLHTRIIIKLHVDQTILIKIPAWCCERDVVLCKFPFAPTAEEENSPRNLIFRSVTLYRNSSQSLAAITYNNFAKCPLLSILS